MLRGLVGAAAIAAIAGGLFAAEPSDFALWAECASGDATAVVIVGSWEVDCVQGWAWSLSHDPGETRDVAAERPKVVEKARKILNEARVESSVFPLGPLDDPKATRPR